MTKPIRKRIAGVVALLILMLMATLVWVEPAIAALSCPPCFGFERLRNNVFVDRSMPASSRMQLESAIAQARTTVESFYGGAAPDPVIVACWSDECQHRLKTRAPAVSYGSYGIRLSPKGIDAVLLAHEFSHIELHRRIGPRQFLFGDMPAWFDEGLAVVVSNDSRYLLPEGTSGSRCREEAGTNLPVTGKDWIRSAGAENALYSRAACRVLMWMDANGGRTAVLSLVDRMAAGQRFSRLYADPKIAAH